MTPFDRAYADLAQALQDILATTPQHDFVSARYNDYLTALQTVVAGQDTQAQCAHAYAIYIAALQQALAAPPQQQPALDAFARYARSIRDAWTNIDPATLTAQTTAVIAQQMLAAASTIGGIATDQPHTGASAPALRSNAG